MSLVSDTAGGVEEQDDMPSYDIRYFNDDGSVTARIAAECTNDMQAKVLAHAMQTKEVKRLEVWYGVTLVYARPEKARPEKPN